MYRSFLMSCIMHSCLMRFARSLSNAEPVYDDANDVHGGNCTQDDASVSSGLGTAMLQKGISKMKIEFALENEPENNASQMPGLLENESDNATSKMSGQLPNLTEEELISMQGVQALQEQPESAVNHDIEELKQAMQVKDDLAFQKQVMQTKDAAITSLQQEMAAQRKQADEFQQQLDDMNVSSQLNPANCTEAVLIEPRPSPAIVRVAESALHQNEINLITLAHGSLNADYVRTLVAGSLALTQAEQQHRLRYLDLQVGDLGGDAPSMMQISRNESSIRASRVQQGHQAAVQRTRSDGNVSGMHMSHTRSAGHSLIQVGLTYHDQYSRILKSKNFWNQLACDRVVVMQSDALFCPASKFRLSDFANYSYIGGETPSMSNSRRIHMNGGFSLRSRPAALACLDVQDPTLHLIPGEDAFFSTCPLLSQPPVDVIDKFAVDNAAKFVNEAPLGVHKPWSLSAYAGHTMDLCEGSRELLAEQPT